MKRLVIISLFLIAGLARAQESPTFFTISVPNMDETVAWYQTMFDMETIRIPPLDTVASIAVLRNKGLMVEVIEHKGSAPVERYVPGLNRRFLIHGLFKVGFFVRNIDEWVARLERKGAKFRGGLVEDKLNRVRTILVLDNNGNIIQLFEKFPDTR